MSIPQIATQMAAPDSRNGVAVFIALLLAFGAAFSYTSWHAERERELGYLTALTELGEKSLDTYFSQIESSLHVLSEDMRGADGAVDVRRASQVLTRYRKAYPDLQIVIVTRLDGQVLASSDVAAGAKLPSLAREPSFILSLDELQQGATLSIGRAFFGPISRKWIIPLRYGARDSTGKLLFLVGVGLPLSKPQSFWKDAPLPPDAALGLMRDDGYLVSRYPVPAEVQLADVYGKAQTGGMMMDMLGQQKIPGKGILEGTSSVSGLKTVGVFRRLSHYPLTVYIGNPLANIWAAWWQKVQVSYALMLVLGAGGIAVYCWANRRRRAWEMERGQRMQELEDANRELQSFSHTVAHDLRAPLRHIDGFVNLWQQQAAGAPAGNGAQYMEKISAAATRMGRMIDDLLAFSRTARTGLNKSAVPLRPLVADIVAELQQDARGRAIEWVTGVLPTVRADRNLLRLALFNLLDNAVKYTGTRAAARIEITSAQEKGNVIITVRDNGVGFDMKYAHKLFSVFQRLHSDKEFEGTGIGLANVARIVQRHGGRVWAESELGQGAAFFVALPDAGES
jgi:signal transduction histidine kinase